MTLTTDFPPAIQESIPNESTLEGLHQPQTIGDVSPKFPSSAAPISAGTAICGPLPSGYAPSLLDPTLNMCADVVDDLERTRIANENRLRQLTRNAEDSDGNERGFGLDESHPDVARLSALVDGLAKLEHDAIKNLQRAMRKHPLGPWVKSKKSVGEKQAARLLASIGDPYWNTLTDSPRTVSQLWAYCGLHTLPVSQGAVDTHVTGAGGDQLGSHPGHYPDDNHKTHAQVAAKRSKGQKANWSANAKMRAWNIAGSTIKGTDPACKTEDGYAHVEGCGCSPYRLVYDRRKEATVDRTHAADCVRCGPAGTPAKADTPWSDAHRHADALRIVSKELLKDLWKASREIHNQPGE